MLAFATYSAVDNNINTLYLLAPVSSTEQMRRNVKKQNTKGAKTLMRAFIKMTAEDYLLSISNTDKIKNYKETLIVFHGTNDKMLPYKMRMESNSEKPKRLPAKVTLLIHACQNLMEVLS